MNKTLSIWAIGLTALLATTLTSCTSDDQDTAYYLAGEWQGYIQDDRQQYAVVFRFYQEDDFATYGTGWETDRGWYDYSEAPFHWWVRNGEIYIQYDDYMQGYFVDDITGETLAEYRLRQTYGNSKQTNFDEQNNK